MHLSLLSAVTTEEHSVSLLSLRLLSFTLPDHRHGKSEIWSNSRCGGPGGSHEPACLNRLIVNFYSRRSDNGDGFVPELVAALIRLLPATKLGKRLLIRPDWHKFEGY